MLPPSSLTSGHSAQKSIETLVVIVAVIVIIAMLAGMIARICGGRLLVVGGDHDIEGWVERKCRSCIDSGVPPPPPMAANVVASEEVKK
ncbi:hypothetical protein IEQ34_003408 [Dendrobium chrysotoxum]|uniref:Transmembrane protein n=1 Tax=Dendrobium chrysotoxum TaxID=161865 RepID=A0AAV7H2M9_DENCH|nr:hypothetical protein IEQ34_003408 [Dendrobium chrysotoxum]